MGVRGLPSVALAALLMTACGSEQVAGEGPTAAGSSPTAYAWEQDCGTAAAEHAPHNPQPRDDPSYNADEYLGLSLDEAQARAKANGLEVRVLGVDGDCEDRTDDLQQKRVNFYVEDGTVEADARF